MKRIITALFTLAALFIAITPTTALAKGVFDDACQGSSSVICQQKNGADGKVNSFVKNLINLLLFIIGIVAVIMIIIAGLRYVTSGGDSNAVSGAKNTILYAVVGLIVAMLAYAIVNFVVAQF